MCQIIACDKRLCVCFFYKKADQLKLALVLLLGVLVFLLPGFATSLRARKALSVYVFSIRNERAFHFVFRTEPFMLGNGFVALDVIGFARRAHYPVTRLFGHQGTPFY